VGEGVFQRGTETKKAKKEKTQVQRSTKESCERSDEVLRSLSGTTELKSELLIGM